MTEPPLDERSLNELARGAADGDRAALTALVARIQHPLYRLALRFLGHPQDAQDATQEILIRIITRLGTFEGRSEFMTWAYGVAIRMLLRTRKRLVESSVRGAQPFADLLDRGLAARDFTAEEAEYRLLCEEVRISGTYGMLLCLSRPLRAAYLLGDVLGIADTAGAAICEITPAAFRQRVSRARRTIRQVIDNRCGLVNSANPCRCGRQIDASLALGILDRDNPTFAHDPREADPPAGVRLEPAAAQLVSPWRSASCTGPTASPPPRRCGRRSSGLAPTNSPQRTGRPVADFKDEISPALVAALACELRRTWPAFPVGPFRPRRRDRVGPARLNAAGAPRRGGPGAGVADPFHRDPSYDHAECKIREALAVNADGPALALAKASWSVSSRGSDR